MDLAVSQRRHNPVDSICRKLKTIQRRDQELDSSSPLHIPRFQSSSYDSPQPGLRCNLEAILKKRAMRHPDHPDTPANAHAALLSTSSSSTTSSFSSSYNNTTSSSNSVYSNSTFTATIMGSSSINSSLSSTLIGTAAGGGGGGAGGGSGMASPNVTPGRPQGRRVTLGASGDSGGGFRGGVASSSPLATPRRATPNATYTITSTMLERRAGGGGGGGGGGGSFASSATGTPTHTGAQRRGGGIWGGGGGSWQRTCSTPAPSAPPSERDGYFTFGRDTPYGGLDGEETPCTDGGGGGGGGGRREEEEEEEEERDRVRSPTHCLLSYNLNFCSSDASTILEPELAYPALVVKRLSLGDGALSSEARRENMTEVSLLCEEDLLDTIFHACDTQRRGKVYVSRIVDYLRHTTSRTSEDSGLEDLCNMLDPERKDISIDLDTYHAVMKEWIDDCRNQDDDTAQNIAQESVKALDSLAARRSVLLNMTSGSLEAIGGETSRNDLETSDLIYCVADLQCTNQKLQEEMRKLKQTMEMMDDNNQKLVEENQELKTQAKMGQQLLQREKLLKEEMEEMKMTLNSVEEARTRATHQTKHMERENQALISKITALQEENIRAAVEMDDLQKKMGELCDINADLQVKVHSFDGVLREKDSVIFERNREIEDLKTAVVEYCSVTEILRADKTKLENQMQLMHPDITASGLSLSVAYRLNQTSLGSLQTELALAQSPLEGGERFSSSMCVASPLDETLDREVLLLMQGPTPEQQSMEHRALIRTLRKEFQEHTYTVQSALRNLGGKQDGQEVSTSKKLQVELEQRRRDWAQTLDQVQQYTDSLEKELLKMASNMRRSRTEILHLSVRVQEQENQKQQLKDELDTLKTPQDSREASCQTPDVPQVDDDPDGPSLEWEEEYAIPESPLPPGLCRPGNGVLLLGAGSHSTTDAKDATSLGDHPSPGAKEASLEGGQPSPVVKEAQGEETRREEEQRGGQLDSGVEEEETTQGESSEASERGRDPNTSTGAAGPQREAVSTASQSQEGAGIPACTGLADAHRQPAACAEQSEHQEAAHPPTHTPAAGPVPSESSKVIPSSPTQGNMVSPNNTPAEVDQVTSQSPRCGEASSPGDPNATPEEQQQQGDTMNHNDSQKLGSQLSPDSGGALESHRSSLLPVAEEEETLLESSVDAVDMATGTHTESSDVTTATADGNSRSADSANQVVPKGGGDITTSDAGAGQSPTGGERGAHKKELEKEQSMESQEGQKAQEDSETSAADKEVSTSALSEDTSEQEDRRNSFSLSASEKEVETEFHRLSLSFKCDMYTLEKRLRLEERSRDLAEENVRKEVASCQGLLQALSPLCEDDSQSVEIIQRLQKNLDILIQSMVRVSSRSETLGAIHQESRVGKAVEVMIQHVENLRRTYTKEHAELVELRESVSNSERSFGTHSDRDDMSRLKKQPGSQYYKPSSSRRVSIAVMSKSPDSGDGENGRRQPWKGGGGGQRPPLKRFVSSGGWPDGEGPRNNMEDSSSPSYPNRFAYDTDSHSEEERREEQPVVVERRKSSLTELGNKLTSLILPLKMQSQSSSPTKDQSPPPSAHNTPEPHRTSISSTSSSTHPSSTSTSSSTSSWSSYLPSWRPGLGLGLGLQGVGVPGRGVWMWALALVVLACLLAVLASLVLQPAADAAPVGTGDSWMTIQQLLWPYTSLRHNGQPPV